jgi:hypothetical protein
MKTKTTPLIHIAITNNNQRLEINGTLELFRMFVASLAGTTSPTIFNPTPEISDLQAAP